MHQLHLFCAPIFSIRLLVLVLAFDYEAIATAALASSSVSVSPPPSSAEAMESAVRVVRFQIDYPKADTGQIAKVPNWEALMRKSVLASLKFVNKHWAICGELGHSQKSPNDCGKLHVTGEALEGSHYRLNATFIASRDPIRNMKVDATSTLHGVVQIGLRGGIFQYTNAMKILGKPSEKIIFEEGYFCYPNHQLVDKKCRPVKQRAFRKHRGVSGR